MITSQLFNVQIDKKLVLLYISTWQILIAKEKVCLTSPVGGLPHASRAAAGGCPVLLPAPCPAPAAPPAAAAAAEGDGAAPAARALNPLGTLASESHMLLRTWRAALHKRHA